jgi:hypothetical protein
LQQDPRYYRSGESGFWRGTMQAFHAIIFTPTDAGGETMATWRFGSAHAATFLSNEWYPDRVNAVELGLEQGTTQIGFDLLPIWHLNSGPTSRKRFCAASGGGKRPLAERSQICSFFRVLVDHTWSRDLRRT